MFGKEELTNLFLQPRTCPHSPRPETDIRQRPCAIAVSHVSLLTTHKKCREVTHIAIPTSCLATSRSS